MACTPSLIAFVVEQFGPGVTSKAMFGEHGIYRRGVLIGLFCDDRLFLKPTAEGARLLGEHERAPPYPGAKPAMIVPEELWGDRGCMARLAEGTAAELLAKSPPKEPARTARKGGAPSRKPRP